MADCVVIDLGSGYTKTGFAGADVPAKLFPTIIGSSKTSEEDFAVGDLCTKDISSFYLSRPVTRGVLTNPSDGEKVIDYALETIGAYSKQSAMLITEPPLVSSSIREKLSQIVFETFETPSFYAMNQSIGSLFSVGRTTGVVVNCGDGMTSVLPITEGISCSHALYTSEYAGSDITKLLEKSLMNYKNPNKVACEVDYYTAEKIKNELFYVSLDPSKGQVREQKYKLPDGSTAIIGNEAFELVETMFNPVYGADKKKRFSQFLKVKALAEAVCESIATSEEGYGVRQTFFQNILLTGGTCKMQGFKARFEKDLKTQAPSQLDIEIVKSGIQNDIVDELNHAWTGGSLISLLSSSKSRFVTKQEYEEMGPSAVTAKISLFES